MTPSSVTQFITITLPISRPFGLGGVIQMRRLVIVETEVIPASCFHYPSQKSTHLPYSSKVRFHGQAALLPAAASLVCWTCRRGTGAARDVSQVTEVD
jgi:hypothetical protein